MEIKIFTIGHSTRSAEQFVALLKMHEIQYLADVRAFPGSRKFPQFNRENMVKWLGDASVKYEHWNALGGRRHGILPDSPNGGWQSPLFQSYADHALTDEWQQSLQDLIKLAETQRVTYMCAERHPSMCHRSIISDWMVAKGVEVLHIVDEKTLQQHQPGKWGAPPVIQDGKVTYPPNLVSNVRKPRKKYQESRRTNFRI